VRVWDASTGKELFAIPGHPLETAKRGTIAFSPDCTRLVTACGDNAVHVYDLASRQRIYRLEGHTGPVLGATVSRDSRLIASVSDDTTIKLWDMATGAEVRTLKGHSREVISAAFSPDGTRLASGSNDETVKLWDVATGQEVLTLRGHTDRVPGVAFSHDGQRIASCSADATVKVWEATPLTPDLRQKRQAAALVNQFTAELLTKEEAMAKLGAEPTIDEPVRREALAMVERYREDSNRLFTEATKVIARPGAAEDEYAQALRRATRASELEPKNYNMLTMIGMGHYRLGQYEKAVAILEQTDSRYVANGNEGGVPWNLAFLAMAHQKLGKSDQAKATLDRLRVIMKSPRWSTVNLYHAMLHEAQSQIDPSSPKPR
jgi:hypothetical protein